MDLTLRDAAEVRAGPPKKSGQSMQSFSGARDGWSGLHPPLTSTEPNNWAPQLLHWGLRPVAVVLARLLTMSELEDNGETRGNRDKMESMMREIGIDTKFVRLVAKTGRVSHVCSMDGNSLYVVLENWAKSDGEDPP